MGLVSEVRRRNVHRMAVLYLVAAWLVMQVVDVLKDNVPVPEWTGLAVFAVLAVGFPIALVISWFYELTPEGISFEQDGQSDASISRFTGRRMDFVIIAVLAAALVVYVFVRPPIPTEPTLGLRNSIAVLPFENLSPDPDNAYFAEGISEEILNVLAGVDGLTVISRTSASLFQDSESSISEIGRALGVGHVLEGSVRKEGNEVRITAQLIDARTDAHLWSNAFERELSDIFAVQEEIAQSVVASISSAFDASAVEVELPTNDLVSYDLYLRSFERSDDISGTFLRGFAMLLAAVDRDPDFAEAWARLAIMSLAAPDWGINIPDVDETAFAEEAARKALELDPELGGAISVQAALAESRKNLIEAEFLYRHAVNVSLDDADTHLYFGVFSLSNGYLGQAISHLERLVELDPMSGNANKLLGSAYLAAGQVALAEPRFAMAMQHDGGFGHVYFNHLLLRGDLDTAITYSNASSGDHPHLLRLRYLLSQALHERTHESIEAVIAEEDTFHKGRHWYNQTIFFALDLRDQLFEHISTEMRRERGGFIMYDLWPAWLPENRAYVEDQHFFEIMDELGSVELWNKIGYPDGCHRVSKASGDHLNCEERYN